MKNKIYWITGLIVLAAVLLVVSSGPKTYKNDEIGISFQRSANYLLVERVEEGRTTVTIMESTDHSRDLLDGKIEAGEGPVSISFDYFPNIPDERIMSWVGQNFESNFQISDGRYEEGEMFDRPVVAYTIDGLYPADVLAMKHRGGILMITGQYQSLEDPIRTELAQIIASLELY